MKRALIFFCLSGFAVSATAQPTPRWKLELTPESGAGLEELYAGCAIPMHDSRLMYISPIAAAENRIRRETWIWDDGWQKIETSSPSPHCECASGTFDTTNGEPVVIWEAFDTEEMRISRWRDGDWHHMDVPGADLAPRENPTVLWDESRQTLLLTSGRTRPDEAEDGACIQEAVGAAWSCYRETWSYDGRWTLLDDGCGSGPHPGCSPESAVWDPVSGRPRLVDIREDRVQLFEFTDRWRLVDESADFHERDPTCLNTTNLALDPRNGNWVGFGGIDLIIDGVSGDYFGFWGWSEVGGWQPFLHRPQEIDPAGQEGARLAYLHDSERFLMFGGHTLNDRDEATNETWLLETKRRGPFGGTGTGGCCATTHPHRGEHILIVLLALIGFRRWTTK